MSTRKLTCPHDECHTVERHLLMARSEVALRLILDGDDRTIAAIMATLFPDDHLDDAA